MSKTREVRPFGARDKFGYLFGDLANDFSFIFASTYVMVFYTKVMGISAAMVGTMFLIARCIDAFTDIGMGRIVDNSKPTKNGRIRPWILRMCGFVALASFMMYQSFLVDASYGAKVAYMFITYILWGSIFYTSINIFIIHFICSSLALSNKIIFIKLCVYFTIKATSFFSSIKRFCGEVFQSNFIYNHYVCLITNKEY